MKMEVLCRITNRTQLKSSKVLQFGKLPLLISTHKRTLHLHIRLFHILTDKVLHYIIMHSRKGEGLFLCVKMTLTKQVSTLSLRYTQLGQFQSRKSTVLADIILHQVHTPYNKVQ